LTRMSGHLSCSRGAAEHAGRARRRTCACNAQGRCSAYCMGLAQAIKEIEAAAVTDPTPAVTPHKRHPQVPEKKTPAVTPEVPEKKTPESMGTRRGTPKKRRLLARKGTFRRSRGGRGARQPQEPVKEEAAEPWLDKATWQALEDADRWRHLPPAVRRQAKAGHSFAVRLGKGSVDVLMRERSYWCRSHSSGSAWPAGSPRSFAWRKHGGPAAAWELAKKACGADL
jgi:hypothetical protein